MTCGLESPRSQAGHLGLGTPQAKSSRSWETGVFYRDGGQGQCQDRPLGEVADEGLEMGESATNPSRTAGAGSLGQAPFFWPQLPHCVWGGVTPRIATHKCWMCRGAEPRTAGPARTQYIIYRQSWWLLALGLPGHRQIPLLCHLRAATGSVLQPAIQ